MRNEPNHRDAVSRVPPRGAGVSNGPNAASGDAAYNKPPARVGRLPSTSAGVGRVPPHGVPVPLRGVRDRGQYKDPAAPYTANLPPLPEGWTWASVDQLSSHITSGSRDWSPYNGKGTGTFILAQNVQPMRLDLSERQAVAAPVGDAETERTRVRVDDLLVTIVGAKTGDVCRVPSELEDHFVCQSVALIRPVVSACAKFAEFYLASQENGQAQWKKYIYGQGRPHLSFEQLRMTAIALPPLAEQTRIVAEVERRLTVVEELESVVSAIQDFLESISLTAESSKLKEGASYERVEFIKRRLSEQYRGRALCSTRLLVPALRTCVPGIRCGVTPGS